MRRRVIKLCMYVLLGAIINVAVAWGMLICEPKPSANPPKNILNGRSIDVEVWAIGRFIQSKSGYPYPSLQRAFFPFDDMTKADALWHNGFLFQGVEWMNLRATQLPVRPIWPGFANNTMFYAAILWLLFAAPGFIRRRIHASQAVPSLRVSDRQQRCLH